tara:strand:+ start:903 stop:1079 length:177 start_codon:yes stop_codon:yes gene_type:complete
MSGVERDGGRIIEIVNIPGKNSDQIIVLTVQGMIIAVLINAGCVIASPIPVDSADTNS